MPPECKIITFPAKPVDPDGVRLGYDFGLWWAEVLAGERLKRRESFSGRTEAEAGIVRLEAEGLKRLPPSPAAMESLK